MEISVRVFIWTEGGIVFVWGGFVGVCVEMLELGCFLENWFGIVLIYELVML